MTKLKGRARNRGFAGSHLVVIILIMVLIGVAGWLVYTRGHNQAATGQTNTQSTAQTNTSSDLSKLDPADFTTDITNPFLTLKPGQTMTYQQQGGDNETVKITIEKETIKIGGFEVRVFHDQAFVDGELEEDTRDYLAQQKSTGDVWYFGEDVNNYEDGKLKNHNGSFHHGTDGALAGIYIKAKQKVGDSYRQENYAGHAIDTIDVVAVDQTVKTKRATYTGCVKFYAWNPLEKNDREYKYNCPEAAVEVFSQDLIDHSQTELTSLTN